MTNANDLWINREDFAIFKQIESSFGECIAFASYCEHAFGFQKALCLKMQYIVRT